MIKISQKYYTIISQEVVPLTKHQVSQQERDIQVKPWDNQVSQIFKKSKVIDNSPCNKKTTNIQIPTVIDLEGFNGRIIQLSNQPV